MDVRFVYFLAVLGFVQCKFNCRTIKKIVDGHNSRRLLIAKGKLDNQPAASHMNMMVWDKQLAEKAQAWASHNNFSHNPDRRIDAKKFSTTGENLYQYSTTADRIMFDPEWALTSWFDEHKHYTYKPLESRDMLRSHPVGHYTQMVWSDSTYVGCGLSEFTQGSWKNIIFVCNYGPAGNYIGKTPYKSGRASGRLYCHSGDCSEKYGEGC